MDNMTDQLPSRDRIFALNTETFGFTPTKSLCLELQLCANEALGPQTPAKTKVLAMQGNWLCSEPPLHTVGSDDALCYTPTPPNHLPPSCVH